MKMEAMNPKINSGSRPCKADLLKVVRDCGNASKAQKTIATNGAALLRSTAGCVDVILV